MSLGFLRPLFGPGLERFMVDLSFSLLSGPGGFYSEL